MNYDEIVAAAKAYADRQDLEIADNMDTFITMAEARINRKLKVRKQTHSMHTNTYENKDMYSLPADYAGMRSVHYSHAPAGGNIRTWELQYISPHEMNNVDEQVFERPFYYTIVANQIKLYPVQGGGSIEMIMYRRVQHIDSSNPTNWLLEDYPDIYLSGIIAEIESFVKNYDVAQLWDSKMTRSIEELTASDEEERWAGSPLQMRYDND